MKVTYFVLPVLFLLGCSVKDTYDVSRYLKPGEQDSVLTSIIAHVSTAPVYTSMQDRFKPEHRTYYAALLPKFMIDRYFVAGDGTHFFYVIRPGSKIGDQRGVGGYFKLSKGFELSGFREVYVTPILPEEELKTRCVFLFDEMVKGTVAPYLRMPSYVQWPNDISVYDTVTYEWKLK